jgi:DNA-binding MurR/RpiR family transcriptional regulator
MTTDTAVPGRVDEVDEALAALRDASARVAELADPAGAPLDEAADHAFDAAEHAARFEDLHAALAGVLDELDRS